MRKLPISFSGPMVLGLLEDRKTQTRRLLPKVRPSTRSLSFQDHGTLPYDVGDQLYVREHWRTFITLDSIAPRDLLADGRGAGIWYEADGSGMSMTREGSRTFGPRESRAPFGKFRQAMHMPRWASRIALTVTDRRIQSLHDINYEDCIAEGVRRRQNILDRWVYSVDGMEGAWDVPQAAYYALLDHLHGPGFSAGNPRLVAYSFTVAMRNVDQLEAA